MRRVSGFSGLKPVIRSQSSRIIRCCCEALNSWRLSNSAVRLFGESKGYMPCGISTPYSMA